MGTIRKSVWIKKGILAFFVACFISSILPVSVLAEEGKTEVVGKLYEFDEDSNYEFHEKAKSQDTTSDNTYGLFSICGNISNVGEKSNVPSYEITDGKLDFYYNYSDAVLNACEDEWHLVDDKSKKVADMKLDSNIMKGAIIIQTSNDRKNWINVEIICNAFSDTPIRTKPIYESKDVQLINGCYYRISIVYELAMRTEESNFLFVNTDKYEYKKCAEVYELYAYINTGEENSVDPNQTYSLGKKVRADNFDGYFGEETIDKGDAHYGWDLGNFFVSGYTDKVTDTNGNVVFLKNVGDKVTLWFKLEQDINRLNGKDKLSITAEKEGYDQYFETPKMDFGRGVLIIRYTDHNNVKTEPTIYTNYLEANTSIGADTKVQLFEEGDYEVALDYQVTSDELIDKTGHYRIFFKFSVRNGNCMVYPFDIKTGNELTNSSMTENGFRLDLAKSRYLKINLKREILKDSADGLVEDTRSNGPAKDGAEYTDEGIYTITVSNEYTGQLTTKKIYVGTNKILRAHMATGLSIPEINTLVDEGATIADDGTIQVATTKPVADTPEVSKTENAETDSNNSETVDGETTESFPVVLVVIPVIIIVFLIVCICSAKKKKRIKQRIESTQINEGGTDR